MNTLTIPNNVATAFEKDRTIMINQINNINFDRSNNLVFKLLNGSAIIWAFPSNKERSDYFYTLNKTIQFNNLTPEKVDDNELNKLDIEQACAYMLENKKTYMEDFYYQHPYRELFNKLDLINLMSDDDYKETIIGVRDLILKVMDIVPSHTLTDMYEIIDKFLTTVKTGNDLRYFLFKQIIKNN